MERGVVIFGCDPELFLARDGQIIGAERVIDKDLPLKWKEYPLPSGWVGPRPVNVPFNQRGVVLDGVQVELNPPASACRESLALNISAAFRAIQEKLEAVNIAGTKVSFEGVVYVAKAEMDALSDKAKQLGCQPSINAYNAKASIKVPKNLELMRSAGGHIHMGLGYPIYGQKQDDNGRYVGATVDQRKRLVPLLDIIVGNTSVLMDRNPLAAERRKIYGKAGEYRLPAHGLEYRTLSNFWLRNYTVFSIVFGLARLACNTLYTTLAWELAKKPQIWPADEGDLENALLKKVDLDLVQRAINTNDIELAKVTYKLLRDFVIEYVPVHSALDAKSVDSFDFFLDTIEKKGLEYWFREDPVTHWGNEKFMGTGAENFLKQTVSGRLAVFEEYGELV